MTIDFYPKEQGSLKDTFCLFETWLFPTKCRGLPPLTRQCSGVFHIRIPKEAERWLQDLLERIDLEQPIWAVVDASAGLKKAQAGRKSYFGCRGVTETCSSSFFVFFSFFLGGGGDSSQFLSLFCACLRDTTRNATILCWVCKGHQGGHRNFWAGGVGCVSLFFSSTAGRSSKLFGQ